MPDLEKLRLVDGILVQLDKPDPEIDKVWADEAKKRLRKYQAGEIRAVAYDFVMSKYRSK
jgi:hypothetical protein